MRARAAFAAAVLGMATFACSWVSAWMFRGPMPEPSAPRIVLSPERLSELDADPDRRVSRLGLHSAPYWMPSDAEIRACELGLWQRAHWDDLEEEVRGYALQIAGVTRYGAHAILIQGFCRAEWERTGVTDELASFPARSFDGCRCHIYARCNPHTGRVSDYGHAACRGR